MASLRLVWDWNGTLLADVDAAVSALNRMLAKRGVKPTTREFYRENFGFPVRPFYAALGVDLAVCDWDEICDDFHAFIAEEPSALRPDAIAAMDVARSLGFRQCVLSALREDLLLRDMAHLGAASYMDCIAGVDNLDGASKLDRGRALVATLEAMPGEPSARVFVGDTLHDAEVAAALGGRCILVDGGHQTAARLAKAGVPVAENLLAAVEIARSFAA